MISPNELFFPPLRLDSLLLRGVLLELESRFANANAAGVKDFLLSEDDTGVDRSTDCLVEDRIFFVLLS